MEAATKADLKELLAEFRSELKQLIAEAFGTRKPVIEAQASGLQVAVDLLPQHVCRDKGDGVEKASLADPLDPLALKASTAPPTTTGDVIPVLDAAAASDKIVAGEAASATAAVNFVVLSDRATPAIVERGLEITLSASSGFTTTLPATCFMGCHLDTNRDTSLADTNICVTEVAAPAFSERIPMLQGSSSSASILKESPEDIHSASNRFITTVPITYSTGCLPQRWMYAQVLLASPPEYNIDDNNIPDAALPLTMRCEFSYVLAPTGHVQRPMAWPSFRAGQLRKINVCESPGNTVEKAFRQCSSDSFQQEGCAAMELQISDICGTISGFHLRAMVRSLELKLLPNGATSIILLTVSLDSGNYAALSREYFGVDNIDRVVPWLFAGCLLVVCLNSSAQLSTHGLIRQKNSHMLLLFWVWKQEELHLGFQFQLCSILPDWYLGNQCIMCSRNCHGAQPDLFWDARCWSADFVTGTYMHVRATCSLQRLLMIGYVPFARFLNVVETLCYELEESVVMDFSHVTELRGAYDSAQLQWGNIVSVLSCGLIHLEKLCLNWKFAYFTIDRPALLIPSQTVALENTELWWYTSALLTEIMSMFSTEFSMQLVVACSVQSILMLTHAYQLLILAPTKFSLACSNLDKHAEQWDIALDCWFNVIKTDCHWCNFKKVQWLYFLLCDIPEADSSSMTICEVLLLHHRELMHWQLAWQHWAHICLITIELSHTHNECCCFLCCYQGKPALLLFLEFDRQAVFQGGRHALNSAICYLLHDNDIAFLHSLDPNGLKVTQVPWDPGDLDLLGSSTTTAWGQAVFQGGRGVSNPLHIMGRCRGPWPIHHHTWLLGSHKLQVYAESNREGHPSWIRRTRHGGGILSPTSALNPTLLSCFFLCTIVLVSS